MEHRKTSSRSNTALTVAGAIVLVLAAVVLAAAGAALWANSKSDGGYVSTGTHRFDTSSHAIFTDSFKVDSDIPSWLFGRARITASSHRRQAGVHRRSPPRATSMRISPT